MQGGTRFFLDRGVGSRIVPDGLRAAGWIVTTMDERYGREASQGIADPTWIRDASQAGEVVITKDRAIAKRPLEAEAIYYSEARVLAIASAQITGPEQLKRLLHNASRIERLSIQPGPWVFGVYTDELRRLRLRYPD
jgi:hypothetical protein